MATPTNTSQASPANAANAGTPAVPSATAMTPPVSAATIPAPAAPAEPPPLPQAVPLSPEEELEAEEFGNFWQQPFAQYVLPFMSSLIFHIALIVIAVLALAVHQAVNEPERRVQNIIPDSEIFTDGPPGGLLHPGLGGDDTRDAFQDMFPDVAPDSPGLAERPGPSLLPSLAGFGENQSEGADLIAIGPGGGRGTAVGLGTGTGDGSGLLAPFGNPGGGAGIGPRSNFLGLGGNARRIVYVCDASGSMLNMFDLLRIELRRSIDRLAPVQSFNVIFFQDTGFLAADRTGLMLATPANKQRTYDFLERTFPRGETNPLPALELAFAQKPELVYLLTDGDFSGPGNDAVVAWCKARTADGKVKINTIAFIPRESRENPQDLEYVKALRQIAEDSGGRFRHVTDDEMGY